MSDHDHDPIVYHADWVFPLSWRKLPLSLNTNPHFYTVAALKRAISDEAIVRAKAANLPRYLDRVHIILHWQPNNHRRRDTDNMAPSLKPIIDGLVKYGLVMDDNSTQVSSESMIHAVVTGGWSKFWVSIERK